MPWHVDFSRHRINQILSYQIDCNMTEVHQYIEAVATHRQHLVELIKGQNRCHDGEWYDIWVYTVKKLNWLKS